MDEGRAYFYNLLTFPLALELNGGAARVVPPFSDGEPFTARALAFPRSFEKSQPVDRFGRQNEIKFGPRGQVTAAATVSVDPEVWPVNQPVQIYLLANLALLRVGMDGQRVTLRSSLTIPATSSATRRAFLFNMTGQSISLVLNGGRAVRIAALPVAKPFTPALAPFARVDTAQPQGEAVFGTTNVVEYALAGSPEAAAQRKLTLQVNPSDWPVDRDVQIYLFQKSALVRLGGNATYATAVIG